MSFFSKIVFASASHVYFLADRGVLTDEERKNIVGFVTLENPAAVFEYERGHNYLKRKKNPIVVDKPISCEGYGGVEFEPCRYPVFATAKTGMGVTIKRTMVDPKTHQTKWIKGGRYESISYWLKLVEKGSSIKEFRLFFLLKKKKRKIYERPDKKAGFKWIHLTKSRGESGHPLKDPMRYNVIKIEKNWVKVREVDFSYGPGHLGRKPVEGWIQIALFELSHDAVEGCDATV